MILVDAHVHIYDCYNLRSFLDSAYANMKLEAEKRGHKGQFTGILMLSETSKQHWFQRLKTHAKEERSIKREDSGSWSFGFTHESSSLCAKNMQGESLVLIEGRQIVTDENLEILALGAENKIEDGHSLKKTVDIAREKGAITVIPYGFGKWVGKRGEVIKRHLVSEKAPGLFLGDNGGRSGWIGMPNILKDGNEKGFTILPGSDPLPLPEEARRVGSFGFIAEESVTPEHPLKDLKNILKNKSGNIRRYGKLMHPFQFLKVQLSLRLRHYS